MSRNVSLILGYSLSVAGGGLLSHGIVLPSLALIVAGLAILVDVWIRFDSTSKDQP